MSKKLNENRSVSELVDFIARSPKQEASFPFWRSFHLTARSDFPSALARGAPWKAAHKKASPSKCAWPKWEKSRLTVAHEEVVRVRLPKRKSADGSTLGPFLATKAAMEDAIESPPDSTRKTTEKADTLRFQRRDVPPGKNRACARDIRDSSKAKKRRTGKGMRGERSRRTVWRETKDLTDNSCSRAPVTTTKKVKGDVWEKKKSGKELANEFNDKEEIDSFAGSVTGFDCEQHETHSQESPTKHVNAETQVLPPSALPRRGRHRLTTKSDQGHVKRKTSTFSWRGRQNQVQRCPRKFFKVRDVAGACSDHDSSCPKNNSVADVFSFCDPLTVNTMETDIENGVSQSNVEGAGRIMQKVNSSLHSRPTLSEMVPDVTRGYVNLNDEGDHGNQEKSEDVERVGVSTISKDTDAQKAKAFRAMKLWDMNTTGDGRDEGGKERERARQPIEKITWQAKKNGSVDLFAAADPLTQDIWEDEEEPIKQGTRGLERFKFGGCQKKRHNDNRDKVGFGKWVGEESLETEGAWDGDVLGNTEKSVMERPREPEEERPHGSYHKSYSANTSRIATASTCQRRGAKSSASPSEDGKIEGNRNFGNVMLNAANMNEEGHSTAGKAGKLNQDESEIKSVPPPRILTATKSETELGRVSNLPSADCSDSRKNSSGSGLSLSYPRGARLRQPSRTPYGFPARCMDEEDPTISCLRKHNLLCTAKYVPRLDDSDSISTPTPPSTTGTDGRHRNESSASTVPPSSFESSPRLFVSDDSDVEHFEQDWRRSPQRRQPLTMTFEAPPIKLDFSDRESGDDK